MPETHDVLIEKFYESFKKKDVAGMISCYHKDIQFEDPVFGKLHGHEAGKMWKMLLEKADDTLKIEYRQVRSTGNSGSAQWEAKYRFGQTGRMVHNKIKAVFEFKDNKIIKHTDDFNFRKWASMALGASGFLLGSTSFLKNRVRSKVKKALSSYSPK